MWGERNCLSFETAVGGIEPPSRRSTVRHSTARPLLLYNPNAHKGLSWDKNPPCCWLKVRCLFCNSSTEGSSFLGNSSLSFGTMNETRSAESWYQRARMSHGVQAEMSSSHEHVCSPSQGATNIWVRRERTSLHRLFDTPRW